MPTYDYACKNCDHRFELFQKFSERPRRTCPECKKRTLYKVLHPAGVVFKGSGFYSTDSRSGSPSTATPSSDKGSSSKSSSKDASDGDGASKSDSSSSDD